MHPPIHLNWVAVVVAVVASFFFGWFWYGPPYRLDATREQFTRAYPESAEFSALKARVDPDKRFRNLLWDAYLEP